MAAAGRFRLLRIFTILPCCIRLLIYAYRRAALGLSVGYPTSSAARVLGLTKPASRGKVPERRWSSVVLVILVAAGHQLEGLNVAVGPIARASS